MRGRERVRREENGRKREQEGIWRVVSWNVAEVESKDKEFWQIIREWKVIVMIETWMEEKGWERMKKSLLKEYKWRAQMAKRRNKKKRIRQGMLMGVKRGLKMEEKKEEKEEGRIICRMKKGEDR